MATKPETKKPSILKSPRLTEKAALAQAKLNTYVFNVEDAATKAAVLSAVKAEYKVMPLDVRFVRTPPERAWIRGKWGVKRGGKKAYVVLKKGDTIAM